MLPPQGDAVDAINPSVELTEAERIDRMRLIRSYNVGPRGTMAQTLQAASA
jgi:DNA processing protein